jgi:prophage regulatory protein
MKNDASTEDRVIRIAEVKKLTGLSRSSIYLMIKKRTFPAQLKLSMRSSGWLLSEVKKWVDDRVRDRPGR